jgi:NADPH:quinone reductase-like Zn-dependent oxidoreductase
VISIGEGVDASLLNKKVAFTSVGCWSQYKELKASKATFIVLDGNTDLKKAAAACVNPLTALGMLEMVRESGGKSYIADAAASSLNKILI